MTQTEQCTIRGSFDVATGTASLPGAWWHRGGESRSDAKYVKISDEDNEAYLRITKREGAGGNEVWVAPGTLDIGVDQTRSGQIENVSEKTYRKGWLLTTKEGRLALLGLAVGALGIIIHGTLAIGSTGVSLVTITSSEHAILLGGATLLEAGGLGVTFVRGVWLRKF